MSALTLHNPEAPADPTLSDVMRELTAIRALLESRPPTGKALSIAAAALLLGVSESFLRKGIAAGKIVATRQGRRVLIGPAELERLTTCGT